MKLTRLLALALLGASLGSQAALTYAQSFDALFARGHALYAEGRYEEAAGAYEALVDAGVEDPDVYFDLGTAWAASSKYARAIVAFERALSLRPSDHGAEQGLSSAEAMLARRHAAREGEATIVRRGNALDAIGRTLSERTWAVTLLALAWLAFGSACALLFARRESLRLALGILSAVGFMLGAIAALGLGARAGTFREGPPAIVLDDDLDLREAPDARARRTGTVHEGDRGVILDSREGFSLVRMVGRGRGWIPSGSLGRTTPN